MQKKLEVAFQKSKKELEEKKRRCVQDENYEEAAQYKEQIDQLEINYLEDLRRSNLVRPIRDANSTSSPPSSQPSSQGSFYTPPPFPNSVKVFPSQPAKNQSSPGSSGQYVTMPSPSASAASPTPAPKASPTTSVSYVPIPTSPTKPTSLSPIVQEIRTTMEISRSDLPTSVSASMILPSSGMGSVRVKDSKKKVTYPEDPRLYEAARSGRFKEVKSLIESEDVNVNALDFQTGNSALHAAVTIQNVDMVYFLVDKGSDVNYKNRRGQTSLHLSTAHLKRGDEMTRYLVEKGNGDLTVADNTGKTPIDLAGSAPQYQRELRDWFAEWKANGNYEEVVTKEEVKEVEASNSEAVQVYMKNGSYYTFVVTDQDTVSSLLPMIAEKLKVPSIMSVLEVSEEVMGKETTLKQSQNIFEAKGKWPNQNPTYCKFRVKLQRGAPGDMQMKFRDAMYGGTR
eukprot:TRINITY_DN10760_c0_g1_i3.p1 TRINITY_DN10760_c0_g1~~TRINITY_DN10760_c0_g1_i3.p1  ORF type:complete len:454 (-),score=144.75 TRINITY_DN10760_c0_g1_i3:223-1584(-)